MTNEEIAVYMDGVLDNQDALMVFKGRNVVVFGAIYHTIAELVGANKQSIVLRNGGRLFDSGNLTECLTKGTVTDFERYPEGLIVLERSTQCEVVLWDHPIP